MGIDTALSGSDFRVLVNDTVIKLILQMAGLGSRNNMTGATDKRQPRTGFGVGALAGDKQAAVVEVVVVVKHGDVGPKQRLRAQVSNHRQVFQRPLGQFAVSIVQIGQRLILLDIELGAPAFTLIIDTGALIQIRGAANVQRGHAQIGKIVVVADPGVVDLGAPAFADGALFGDADQPAIAVGFTVIVEVGSGQLPLAPGVQVARFGFQHVATGFQKAWCQA